MYSSKTIATTYQKYGGLFTTPANATGVRIKLYNYLTTGWVAFDDISLVEVNTNTSYYYAGGQRVAQRTGTARQQYIFSDHLGSTALVTDGSMDRISEMRYNPWGGIRYSIGTTPADNAYTYTGQRQEADLGLMFYNARWYDPYLNQFLTPDSIIPDLYNPIDYDRYTYARNNPIRYSDPSGHDIWDTIGQIATGFVFEFSRTNAWYSPQAQQTLAVNQSETVAMLAGRVAADVVTVIVGVAEFSGGLTIGATGVAASCATTLCIMSPAAVSVGVGVAAVGASTATAGAVGLGGNLALLTGGSGSSAPGFASSKDLTNHFLKHGSEFGFKTEAQYLNGAQDFAATKGGKGVLVKVRANGDTVIYNPTTNEFAVTKSNGTIKTYLNLILPFTASQQT